MSYKDLLLMLQEKDLKTDPNYPKEKPEDNLTDSYLFEEHEQYIKVKDE